MALARRRIGIDRSEGTCEFRGNCGDLAFNLHLTGINGISVGNQDRIVVHKLRLESVEDCLGLRGEGDRDDAGAFGGLIHLVIFKMGGVVSLVQA